MTSNRAHCGSCHRTFSGPSLFDRHRLSFECHDPATITNDKTKLPVMVLKGDTWGGYVTDDE